MTVEYGAYEEGRGMNYWDVDPVLRREVARTYPEEIHSWATERLSSLAGACGTTIADNSDTLDDHPPELRTHDKDGNLLNEVEYHPAQFENERIAYGEGAVADSFQTPPGLDEPAPILHNLAMDYLLCYDDIGLVCPVAMTAGVALVLEKYDDGSLEEFFAGLTTREYDDLVQGAMFLTEKQGGSDVGATETTAVEVTDDTWRLSGEKWFCSNLDAGAALTLARTEGAPAGTAGLSLFLLPRTKRNGEPNDYRFRRLKDKLGTKSVPTGEVELEAAEAYLVGEEERGFAYMSEMLNLERLSNAMGACGAMGRAVLEAKVRAANREAFGSTLDELPLMRRDLIELTLDHEAATAFTFDAASVYSDYRDENDEDAYRLMRILVPVAKYKTGRLGVDVTSYAMEILGGDGYVNTHVTNRLLRDVQVLPIWEGTSNILSLDVLRAMAREASHAPLLAAIDDYLAEASDPALADLVDRVRTHREDLEERFHELATVDRADAEYRAKVTADRIYETHTAALLLAEAAAGLDDGDARGAVVARLFVERELGDGLPEDRLGPEAFDAVVRHADLDPTTLEAAAATADD